MIDAESWTLTICLCLQIYKTVDNKNIIGLLNVNDKLKKGI